MGYGTKIGGYKTREKLLANDPDYYHKIGKLGGVGGTKKTRAKKGFGSNREVARAAGRLGGAISTRADEKLSTEQQIAIRKRIAQDIQLEQENDVSIH